MRSARASILYVRSAVAFIVVCLSASIVHEAFAADQRFTMQVCKRDGPCAFVLDTTTGEVRYCEPNGCRVLDAGAPAERPNPFPLAGQGPIPEQGTQPFPLGEMGAPDTSVLEQINQPPANGGGDPSPFPYVEPAPAAE